MLRRLLLLGSGLALPTLAWALPGAGPYTGDGWKIAVLAPIALIQLFVLVIAGKCPVDRALLAAFVGTSAYGVALANLPIQDVSLASPLCALAVGVPVTWVFLTAGRHAGGLPLSEKRRLISVVLYMNLVTMWGVPQAQTLNDSRAYDDTASSRTNLRFIGEGLRAYAAEHQGKLPQVANTSALAQALAAYGVPATRFYAPYRKWWQLSAPQGADLMYTMLVPWPTHLEAKVEKQHSSRALLADPAIAVYSHVCLFADGQAAWVSSGAYQGLLTSKDHTMSQ